MTIKYEKEQRELAQHRIDAERELRIEPQHANENEIKVPFLKKITPYDKGGIPGELQLVLGNGKVFHIYLDEISEQNKTRAMWHGLSQRFGDSVAGCSKDNAFGHAFKTFEELFATMRTADWTKPGTGGKIETLESINDLIESIAKIKKQPVEKIATVVNGATREQRDTWRKNAEVNAELQSIMAKRAKAALKDAPDFDFPI
jgi:hypothetical protein